MVFFKVNEYEDGRMGQHYTADGHARIMSNKKRYWQTENTVTYDFIRNRHKLTVMGGFSASQTDYEEVTADSKGLNATTKYNNLGGATTHGPNGSYASASTLVSFYGRATYNFDERYLVTLTMRGDGSSRFAPGHQWGYFPRWPPHGVSPKKNSCKTPNGLTTSNCASAPVCSATRTSVTTLRCADQSGRIRSRLRLRQQPRLGSRLQQYQ